MYHKGRVAFASCNLLYSNIEFVHILPTTDNGLWTGDLVMLMFHFLSFGTPHTFWDVAP